MAKVIVFAGTTEGYSIGEFLRKHQVSSCICTATEYGASLAEEDDIISVRSGRMDSLQMEEFFGQEAPELVIDATHPYAAEATENIRKACENTQLPYCRVLRNQGQKAEDVIYAESTEEAVSFLSGTEGNILLTTGSKELEAYSRIPDFRERVYARVLPLPSVVESCQRLGLTGPHLICMQGPFSKEMNQAMLKQYVCRYLVTKDTGTAGGFQEKTEAARDCRAMTVVIGRPPEVEGISVFECRKLLTEKFGLTHKPEITLVGIGMGSEKTMTAEGKAVCEKAELLIGAARMVDAVRLAGQDYLYEYRSDEIAEYIGNHSEYEKIAVVLSGDTGFYSGARKLLDVLGEDTPVICGISSVSYFMSKVGMSWEDAVLLSVHGRRSNLVGAIRENRKVFAILGTADGVRNLARRLTDYGMGDVYLHVGVRLSYEDETIFVKRAEELTAYEGDPLTVVLAVNERPSGRPCPGEIPDSAFIRDKVPMTKEEIRMVSIGKLHLKKDSICYDVGAGTGSVSVEMARFAVDGAVYAIEKNETALSLIEENRKKFCTDNLYPVPGIAPDALTGLPVPTHVFIGGTSGHMGEILQAVLHKNPDARIVINCITLETVSEALQTAKQLDFEVFDMVQVSAARSKSTGRYHMMMGENPVYILTLCHPRQFPVQEEEE